jgi:hypothetical protein
MKLSLVGCASVVALTAFTMTGNGAIAAEQTNPYPPGQGCDLRITPGCKPGPVMTPTGSNDANGPHGPSGNSGAGSSGNVDIQRSHNGNGDQQKRPTGTSSPPPPPPSTPQVRNKGEGCDLRVGKGSDCESGRTVNPDQKFYNPPEPSHPSSSSGGDHRHYMHTEKEQTKILNENSSNHGTDQPPPPHPQ